MSPRNSQNDRAEQPTEYGGYSDPDRTPPGYTRVKSASELARDMRRAGLRERAGLKPEK